MKKKRNDIKIVDGEEIIEESDSDTGSVTYNSQIFGCKLSKDTCVPEQEGKDLQEISFTTVDSSESEIIIPKASKNKYHFCLFCEKPQSRLPRHLMDRHKNEKGMINYLKASGKDRKKELSKIRNAGDYRPNVAVKKAGKGEYVAKRRKSKGCALVENYVHCPACLGFFQKRDLYRHDCPEGKQGPRRNLAKKGRLLLPESARSPDMKDQLRAFWEDMRQDARLLAARKDDIINELVGNCLKIKGNERISFNEIRNKARELGRLLIELRATAKLPSGSLSDFLRPDFFPTVVKAAKTVAGFNESDCTFQTPSLAKKLGHSITACADIIEKKAIENRDEHLQKSAKDFLKLYRRKWRIEISSHAERTLQKKRRGKRKRIPLCRDVAKLSEHLQKKTQEASNRLKNWDTSNIH